MHRVSFIGLSFLPIVALAVACGSSSSNDTSGAGGSGGSSSTTGGGSSCPAENFLDVSSFEGAGANYPKPSLSVACTDSEVVVTSNGIPHYEFVATTPNDLKAQNHEYRFPLAPTYSETPTDIPLLGDAGVAVNGAPFYGPNEAQMPDPYGDPVYNGIMDDCLGHTGAVGDYHYHALLVACLTKDADPSKASPIVAYAFDGFPVYGPYECADTNCTSLIEMRSSWEKTGDPSTYAWDNNACTKATCDAPEGEFLDRCNGHFGPNGDYHYHATLAKQEPTYTGFPYILGCYHGAPANNVAATTAAGGGMGLPTCMPGQMMCCGDGICDGPETAANCPGDCN